MLDVMEGGPKLRKWYGQDSSVGAPGAERPDPPPGGGDADLDLRMTERARRGRVSVATRGADAFGAGEAREQSGTRRPAPSRF